MLKYVFVREFEGGQEQRCTVGLHKETTASELQDLLVVNLHFDTSTHVLAGFKLVGAVEDSPLVVPVSTFVELMKQNEIKENVVVVQLKEKVQEQDQGEGQNTAAVKLKAVKLIWEDFDAHPIFEWSKGDDKEVEKAKEYITNIVEWKKELIDLNKEKRQLGCVENWQNQNISIDRSISIAIKICNKYLLKISKRKNSTSDKVGLYVSSAGSSLTNEERSKLKWVSLKPYLERSTQFQDSDFKTIVGLLDNSMSIVFSEDDSNSNASASTFDENFSDSNDSEGESTGNSLQEQEKPKRQRQKDGKQGNEPKKPRKEDGNNNSSSSSSSSSSIIAKVSGKTDENKRQGLRSSKNK